MHAQVRLSAGLRVQRLRLLQSNQVNKGRSAASFMLPPIAAHRKV
jgi:hypothetical protein